MGQGAETAKPKIHANAMIVSGTALLNINYLLSKNIAY